MAKKRYNGRNRKKGRVILFLFVLAVLIAGVGYIYTSPEFEREKPTITGADKIFWNAQTPISVNLNDNAGLKEYEVKLDGQTIAQGSVSDKSKSFVLKIKIPPTMKAEKRKRGHFVLDVTVVDNSMWNFMQGNSAHREIKVTVDSKRPNVNILANSRMINQGGSALVVFGAEDENLEQLYIQANGNRFKPIPYKKEGYFAALIAWPFTDENFDAKIVATDKAGNKRETHIPFYHGNPRYKVSKIRATDKFIDGKITDLASNDPEYAQIDDKLEKLKAINETMRLKNEALIHKLSKNVSDEMISEWKIKRFYPLKNGKRVASFGDHRYYYYKDKNHIVSESYHVGYDLASTKMADVISSNPGRVVFADENGIYGNMPLIDHGLGLYSLYGHCSKLLVHEGDEVAAGEVIAKTGMTGLALGDHLHFGILVQGIEVRPVEWFDSKWIKKFITNVFTEADRIISPVSVKDKENK